MSGMPIRRWSLGVAGKCTGASLRQSKFSGKILIPGKNLARVVVNLQRSGEDNQAVFLPFRPGLATCIDHGITH